MIEEMSHIAIVSNSAARTGLLSWLAGQRAFHPMPLDDDSEAWKRNFSALPDETAALDARLVRVNSVVSFCQEFSSAKPGFLDSMLPLKVVGSKDEIEMAVEEVDIELLYGRTAEMRSGIEAAAEAAARLQAKKSAVEKLAFLGDDLPKLLDLKAVRLELVAAPGQGGRGFLLDDRIASGDVAAEELFADRVHAYFALAVPASAGELLKSLIEEHGLHIHPIPDVKLGAAEELRRLELDIQSAAKVMENRRTEAARFADAWLRKASLAAGHWESEKNLAAARLTMAESQHLFFARGYVKTGELADFRQKLEAREAGAAAIACEAPRGEEPPISLKWNKWISPASLIVKMYGLPTYRGIDPTPYVASIFFIFVGICLGDAAYGLALVLLMRWLQAKYREQEHLQDFFQAFVYFGYCAIGVGVLTGSFMADIFKYLPGFGWLDRIRVALTCIDPITDSQNALYIAVGIGVLTQFYGLGLVVYRNWRRGDRMGAFSDGILWICFLVFVMLAAATGSGFFWFLFCLSTLGLVVTQGRDQKNPVARLLVGVISLYGVVGSYGVSAILGDFISYARLMALGLTGSVLGSTFNMLAGLSVDIPGIGLILATGLIVGGHLMNFALALLGAFVHSVRLVMLEFFSRFYEAGGYAYQPYGFRSLNVNVRREAREEAAARVIAVTTAGT